MNRTRWATRKNSRRTCIQSTRSKDRRRTHSGRTKTSRFPSATLKTGKHRHGPPFTGFGRFGGQRGARQFRFLFLLLRLLRRAAAAALFQVWYQQGPEEVLVQVLRASRARVPQVHGSAQPEPKVERNEVDDELARRFEDPEHGHYDPVREPLRVVVVASRIDTFEGHVRGVYEPGQIQDELLSPDQRKQSGQNEARAGEKVHLRVTRLFLQIAEPVYVT